jgi:Na+/H+ antiporter NhaD/arsenite permease-like protein
VKVISFLSFNTMLYQNFFLSLLGGAISICTGFFYAYLLSEQLKHQLAKDRPQQTFPTRLIALRPLILIIILLIILRSQILSPILILTLFCFSAGAGALHRLNKHSHERT